GETQGLHIEFSADAVAVAAGPGVELEIGSAAEFAADVDLQEPASTLWGTERSRIVAKAGELEPPDSTGGDFRSAEFPAHAIDEANGKLDHIAAGDLKRQLRFNRERLHGFDLADAGADCAVRSEAIGQDSERSHRIAEVERNGGGTGGSIGLDAGVPVDRSGEVRTRPLGPIWP